ncbi:uncharacterized protein LOC127082095 [Lathyrus oleraceus]|uniref:uncharacterized protein LOC127082095 n=1 Tax=Pisum sativum TaxID=3888 RepID=UPI0021D2724C|nr:uncharacterized protein LOC127082095 [Pisum sativum]
MVHLDVFPKHVVSSNVKGVVVNAVDIGNQIKNEQEFEFRDHMLQWIHTEASKLGFCVVIGTSDNGSDRGCTFVIIICERSGKYRPPLQTFKLDDVGSRKCECPFKLCGYMLVSHDKEYEKSVKLAVGTKDIEFEDGKMVKAGKCARNILIC